MSTSTADGFLPEWMARHNFKTLAVRMPDAGDIATLQRGVLRSWHLREQRKRSLNAGTINWVNGLKPDVAGATDVARPITKNLVDETHQSKTPLQAATTSVFEPSPRFKQLTGAGVPS